jgi:DNA-binding transcriptional MerR regulator
MDMRTYSLKELAELTGLEARTIRSYIAKGLLQGPMSRGRTASYSEHHLERLQQIQVLKSRGMSLDEIRQSLLHAHTRLDPARSLPILRGRPRRDAALESPMDRIDAFDFHVSIPETRGVDAPLLRLLRILQGAVHTRDAHRRSKTEIWTQVEVTPEIQLQVRGELSERERELVREIADHLRDILLGEDEAPL